MCIVHKRENNLEKEGGRTKWTIESNKENAWWRKYTFSQSKCHPSPPLHFSQFIIYGLHGKSMPVLFYLYGREGYKEREKRER